MGMLRWICGMAHNDKVGNDHIRGSTRMAQASKKMSERRLNYGEKTLLRKVRGWICQEKRSDDDRKQNGKGRAKKQ